MPDSLELLIELLDLPCREIKFFFSSLDIGKKMSLWLVGPLKKSLMEFDISLKVFNLILESKNFCLHCFSFFLFLLKPICKKETLLDSSLCSCWSISDCLNQGVANIISSITLDLVIFCYMHDCLIEFLFNHFIISKPLSCDCKFCFYISITLASGAFKLVVFRF